MCFRRSNWAPFGVTGATFCQWCVLRDLLSSQGQWIRTDSSHCGCVVLWYISCGQPLLYGAFSSQRGMWQSILLCSAFAASFTFARSCVGP